MVHFVFQENQPEPDAALAMEIGSDPSSAVGGERYNAAPQVGYDKEIYPHTVL